MDIDTSIESKNEYELFKNLSFSDSDRKICPLEYWNNQHASFPKLSKVALRLLSTPATNSSSERSFSAAGNTITHHRNSMSSTVEQLLFVKSNKDIV